MTDTLTPQQRSLRMAKIHGKDTKPEMVVRRLVHGLGFRYRLHRKDLPGKPDLVFSSRRRVIFVHGCFWHGHGAGCPLTRLPKSNTEFWKSKIESNRARDERNIHQLKELGWRVMIVWECELRDLAGVKDKILAFLNGELDGGES